MFKELNILKPFFDYPKKEYSVRDIARNIKISPATASKKLQELHDKQVLRYRPERNLDLYSADMESQIFRDLKVYYNISKIRKSGIIEAINKQYIKPTIILFGSSVSGLDTETSDIDMTIISENTSEFNEKKIYEKILGKELQLIIVKDLIKIKNRHLINNILNGITLQGEIRWT